MRPHSLESTLVQISLIDMLQSYYASLDVALYYISADIFTSCDLSTCIYISAITVNKVKNHIPVYDIGYIGIS